MKFCHAQTRKEAIGRLGSDWYKIVKVCGGWMFFDNVNEHKQWLNQK